jgi:hypothetical protein
MLRAFYDLATHLGQIHSFHRLKAKIIKVVVTGVVYDLLILTAKLMDVMLEVVIQ